MARLLYSCLNMWLEEAEAVSERLVAEGHLLIVLPVASVTSPSLKGIQVARFHFPHGGRRAVLDT